jgi:hypothetical protein
MLNHATPDFKYHGFIIHSQVTTHLPASKSAVILNVISKAGTALGLLALSFDFTDTGTKFVA